MTVRREKTGHYVGKISSRPIAGILLFMAFMLIGTPVGARGFLEEVGGAVSNGLIDANRKATEDAAEANRRATQAAADANRRATEAAAEANRKATEATAEANRIAAEALAKQNEENAKALADANRKATETAALANRLAAEAAAKANDNATKGLANANREVTDAVADANSRATEAAAKFNEEAAKFAAGANTNITTSLAQANQQATQVLARTNADVTQGVQHAAEQAKKMKADINRNIEKAARDTVAEVGRTGRGLETAAQAIGHYLENQYRSTGQALTNAERRMREGKVVDALWHLSSEPYQSMSQNMAIAAQESAYLNTVAQVAASAYGGPQGAAAYAAWLTYNQTGNPELALRAGVLTFATSSAFKAAGTLESSTTSQLARKVAVTASIGGIAVAAAGGNEHAIRDGFFKAGAMVVVQDGYKRYLGSEIDGRASKGEAYCMTTIGEKCSPPIEAYRRGPDGEILKDSKGLPIIDMDKVDPRVPHVGSWSGPETKNWSEERSVFMTSVSRVPGMNAMALFHDQWSVSWDMNAITNVVTIGPAIVLTYIGTGTDYYDLLQKTVAANAKPATDVATPGQLSAAPQAKPISVIALPTAQAAQKIPTGETHVVQLPLYDLRSNLVLFSAMCSGDSGSSRIYVEVTEPYGTACQVIAVSPTDEISVLKKAGQIKECLDTANGQVQKLTHANTYCFTRDTAGRIEGDNAPPELIKAVNVTRNRPLPGWRLKTIGAIFLALLLVVGALLGFFSGRIWQHRKHLKSLVGTKPTAESSPG